MHKHLCITYICGYSIYVIPRVYKILYKAKVISWNLSLATRARPVKSIYYSYFVGAEIVLKLILHNFQYKLLVRNNFNELKNPVPPKNTQYIICHIFNDPSKTS